jgi:Protein of unknown function (DUF2605)
MLSSNSPDAELLKSVLEPLLQDFQHWFARSIDLLESERIPFLAAQDQQDLLQRVQDAQQQVNASKLMSATFDNQVGVDMPVVMAWHRLVHECWGIALRFRQYQQNRAI